MRRPDCVSLHLWSKNTTENESTGEFTRKISGLREPCLSHQGLLWWSARRCETAVLSPMPRRLSHTRVSNSVLSNFPYPQLSTEYQRNLIDLFLHILRPVTHDLIFLSYFAWGANADVTGGGMDLIVCQV